MVSNLKHALGERVFWMLSPVHFMGDCDFCLQREKHIEGCIWILNFPKKPRDAVFLWSQFCLSMLGNWEMMHGGHAVFITAAHSESCAEINIGCLVPPFVKT
ncbi:hypothetical protein NMG60_11018288 [Bertholletia excelsa]